MGNEGKFARIEPGAGVQEFGVFVNGRCMSWFASMRSADAFAGFLNAAHQRELDLEWNKAVEHVAYWLEGRDRCTAERECAEEIRTLKREVTNNGK
jgi:hypothetical protein